jgi:hypothetical protein
MASSSNDHSTVTVPTTDHHPKKTAQNKIPGGPNKYMKKYVIQEGGKLQNNAGLIERHEKIHIERYGTPSEWSCSGGGIYNIADEDTTYLKGFCKYFSNEWKSILEAWVTGSSVIKPWSEKNPPHTCEDVCRRLYAIMYRQLRNAKESNRHFNAEGTISRACAVHTHASQAATSAMDIILHLEERLKEEEVSEVERHDIIRSKDQSEYIVDCIESTVHSFDRGNWKGIYNMKTGTYDKHCGEDGL